MVEDNGRLLDDNYRIIRRLGGGATSHVYLAEDTAKRTGHDLCAVKELNPNTSNPDEHEEFRARFRDEEMYLQTLDGFGGQIPKFYEYLTVRDGDGRQRHYIVQEYVAGKTLREVLRDEGRLKQAKVKDVLLSLLPVIAHIHASGYIHRDINPANIILRDPDELPVLIDFGAVKEVVTTFVASPADADPQTRVIGKRGYMAPEHLRGRPIPASDLYSLGVTAIELLTGLKPWELEHDFVAGTLSWRGDVPNLTPDFAAVLDKAVKGDAERRYRDAPAMLAALAPVPVPESDDKFRQQLRELLPAESERRPRPPKSSYQKCRECTFYVLAEDEHCLNCGAFNLRLLSADQRHLLKKSPREHLVLLHSRGAESWVIASTLDYLKYTGKDEDFNAIVAVPAAAGFIVGGGIWWLSESFFYGGGGGFLVAACLFALGMVTRTLYSRRVWEISNKKRNLLERVRKRTDSIRRDGRYLGLIEKEVAGLIAENSKEEAKIERRLRSTERAVEEIAGASELQQDKEDLSRALSEARRRAKKYQVKQLEIKLLILHNQLQAQACVESMDEVTGDAIERQLDEMSKIVSQMMGALKDATILDSAIGRRWAARIFRAEKVVARSRRLLTKQMNAVVMRRANATIPPPEEFIHNLDLLNAYITYEDFDHEYQALQAE